MSLLRSSHATCHTCADCRCMQHSTPCHVRSWVWLCNSMVAPRLQPAFLAPAGSRGKATPYTAQPYFGSINHLSSQPGNASECRPWMSGAHHTSALPWTMSSYITFCLNNTQVKQGFLHIFCHQRGSSRDAQYARLNFAYVMAEFLGWLEVGAVAVAVALLCWCIAPVFRPSSVRVLCGWAGVECAMRGAIACCSSQPAGLQNILCMACLHDVLACMTCLQVIRREIVFIAGGAEDSAVLSGLVDAIKWVTLFSTFCILFVCCVRVCVCVCVFPGVLCCAVYVLGCAVLFELSLCNCMVWVIVMGTGVRVSRFTQCSSITRIHTVTHHTPVPPHAAHLVTQFVIWSLVGLRSPGRHPCRAMPPGAVSTTPPLMPTPPSCSSTQVNHYGKV